MRRLSVGAILALTGQLGRGVVCPETNFGHRPYGIGHGFTDPRAEKAEAQIVVRVRRRVVVAVRRSAVARVVVPTPAAVVPI